jgi:hypothetical protein
MSPVQWLVDQVNADCTNSTFIQQHLIDQALEMEKQQTHKGGELETFKDHISDIGKMVVYTHDDVIQMMDKFHTSILNRDLCMAKLTPIEVNIQEKSGIPINLYTEEQVKELLYYYDLEIKKHLLNYSIEHSIHSKMCDGINDVRNTYIQSLKQPKQ